MMKKMILLLILGWTLAINCPAQQASQPPNQTTEQTDTTAEPEQGQVTIQTDSTGIPDTLVFEMNGQVFKVPAKDLKDLVAATKPFIEENQGNWPNTASGWAILIVTFLLSARGAVFVTQARKTASVFIKLFGKSNRPINTVVLVSGALATGMTFIFGKGSFDTQFFLAALGLIFTASVYIYERWIKPKAKAKK